MMSKEERIAKRNAKKAAKANMTPEEKTARRHERIGKISIFVAGVAAGIGGTLTVQKVAAGKNCCDCNCDENTSTDDTTEFDTELADAVAKLAAV